MLEWLDVRLVGRCRTLRPRPQSMPGSSYRSNVANVLVIGTGAAIWYLSDTAEFTRKDVPAAPK